MPTLTMPTPKEFSWIECLRYLKRSDLEILHRTAGESVAKLVHIDGASVFLRVRTSAPNTLLVNYHTTEGTALLPDAVSVYVAQWFDLNTDLGPYYALAEQDPLLALAAQRHYGLRLIAIPDLFEALCWAII